MSCTFAHLESHPLAACFVDHSLMCLTHFLPFVVFSCLSSSLFSLVLSCLSTFIFSCLPALSRLLCLLNLFCLSLLFRLLFSLCLLSLSLSVSPCDVVCVMLLVVVVCVCCVCVCVCCGTLKKTRKNPPCVHPRRLRVSIQSVLVYAGTTRTCVSTRARVAGTHGTF